MQKGINNDEEAFTYFHSHNFSIKLRSHFLLLLQRILRNPLLVGTKLLYIRSIFHTKNVHWKTIILFLLECFTSASQLISGVTADLQYPNFTSTGSVSWFSKIFEFDISTSTAKQVSFYYLSVNWLYVAFCNRIFNFSLVLCLLWNGVGVVRVLCSPGYRLCSVVKCVVSSVLGNSLCKIFKLSIKKKSLLVRNESEIHQGFAYKH